MWIGLAVAAGCFQTARNALAQSLAAQVSPFLNSWSRFAFNLPLASLLVVFLTWRFGTPVTSAVFFAYCAATAATQLLGNVALVTAFRTANFAESIALHKLEIVFTALIGVTIFDERPSATGWLGVFLCGAGVLLINRGRASGPAGWRRAFHLDRGGLLALTCAVLLVFASFLLKGATAEFAELNPHVGTGRFEAAAHTLFHTTWIEVAILTCILLAREPRELLRVRQHWRRMALIGASGFCGSLCWFWAYSIALVAYVKAVGQIEAVLAVVISLVVLREHEVRGQLPGIALVLAGILTILLG